MFSAGSSSGRISRRPERLQKQFTLTAPGSVTVDPPVAIALFTSDKLPGAEALDRASAILASETDINPGMAPLQEQVVAVEALVKSGNEGRARVQTVIETVAWPALQDKLQNLGVLRNGWGRPGTIGNYGKDYLSRTAINLIGIWANNTGEVVYFKTDSDGVGTKLDGGKTSAITFPADALPLSNVRYFWSVITVNSVKFQVILNALDRFLLNKKSGVERLPTAGSPSTLRRSSQPIRLSPTGCPRPRARTTISHSASMDRALTWWTPLTFHPKSSPFRSLLLGLSGCILSLVRPPCCPAPPRWRSRTS